MIAFAISPLRVLSLTQFQIRAAAVAAGMLACFCTTGGAEPAADRIQPYAKNAYYWQYKQKPVLLLGGSVDDNLFQIAGRSEQLDLLKSAGGNYVRNTMSSRDDGNVWPFARRGEKYDLDRFNDAYWERFERFLAETARRDIIVQIELWATFDYYRDTWERNPFNPKNNVNYTAERSGLPLRVNSHPTRAENDFFRSVPGAMNLQVALRYQQRFVDKLLQHSLEYDHVLYAMDNETSVTPNWGAYWAGFIRERAAGRGKVVETTEMWDPWDVGHRMHDATFGHPALYSFADVSQNNHMKGQAHYDNPLKRRLSIAGRPRPMNNVKIYGADRGRFGNTRDGVERFWRNIFGGHAAVRFHRPDSGIGLSERAQQMIRAARAVTSAFDLFACAPHPELLADRDANEAYCVAAPGTAYAVYFPAGGEVRLDLSAAPEPLSLRWYEIEANKWLPATGVPNRSPLTVRTPRSGHWAVVIQRKKQEGE